MSKFDEDIDNELKKIDELIEQVKKEQEKEKKIQKNKQPKKKPNVIRIDLGVRYSSIFIVHLLVSFMINFLLIILINRLFSFFMFENIYILLIFSLSYTLYEELYKLVLTKKYAALVLHSYGFIYYLLNILFVYALDLWVFQESLSFVSVISPLVFVLVLQLFRVIVRNIYFFVIHELHRLLNKKSRK